MYLGVFVLRMSACKLWISCKHSKFIFYILLNLLANEIEVKCREPNRKSSRYAILRVTPECLGGGLEQRYAVACIRY